MRAINGVEISWNHAWGKNIYKDFILEFMTFKVKDSYIPAISAHNADRNLAFTIFLKGKEDCDFIIGAMEELKRGMDRSDRQQELPLGQEGKEIRPATPRDQSGISDNHGGSSRG